MGIAGILGSHSLACWMIARHGTEEQKPRYLPDLATGARRTGIAPDRARRRHRPAGHPDRRPPRRRPLRRQRHARPGSPTPATPTRCPCCARPTRRASPPTAACRCCWSTPARRASRSLRDLPKLGYKGTESCEVVLDDVRVPGDAPARRRRGPGHAAGAVGAGDRPDQHRRPRARHRPGRLRRGACATPRQREAFGQPIAEFQAIQLKLADMATQIQAARLLVYWAAPPRPTPGARVDIGGGMAKVFASEAALPPALEAMRSTAATATPRSSWSSGSTATRR